MEKPYSGKKELSDVQRSFLLALLLGPILSTDIVERGAAEAALQLRETNLVEWIPRTGWRLTPDGATLAKRIAADRASGGAHEKGTAG